MEKIAGIKQEVTWLKEATNLSPVLGFPIIGLLKLINRDGPIKTLVETNHVLEKGQVQLATEKLLNFLNIPVETQSVPELLSRDNHKPVLLIANHDGLFEPFVIGFVSERSDIWFIGQAEFNRLGKKIAEHIIPVTAKADSKTSWQPLSRFNKIIDSMMRGKRKTKEEIDKMNHASYQLAANKLAGNGVVVIFPTGGTHAIEKHWFSGLGKVISNIPVDQRGKVQIVPVYLTGASRENSIKQVKQAIFAGQTKEPMSMMTSFAQPCSINEIIREGDNQEAIINKIKEYYLKQFNLQDYSQI